MNNQLTPFAGTWDSIRIVVATDLQPRSDLALRRAVTLADSLGSAKLMVVHALTKAQSRSRARAVRNTAYAKLLSAVDEATVERRSVAIEIDARVGKPLDVIADAAREAQADLIVIAAPTSRRMDSIVGTTAERLIRATQLPVLVVHREAETMYRSAAVATDLAAGSVSLLQSAARFGVFEQAQTTVFHAFDPPYAGLMKLAGVDDLERKRYNLRWVDDLENDARKMLTEAGIVPDKANIVVQPTAPTEAIRGLLAQGKQELLVIGTSRWFLMKRLLIGSIADQVLRTSATDVLVIPRKLEKAYMSRLRYATPKLTSAVQSEVRL